ncbi:hypothetical protein RB195_001006 [Necator americanus]|uniref:C-type lectin domain-containing protein n=1 Tax=Necator americanus TaxID=51031 RepID=A0ABR1DF91_NECAM
MKATLLLIAIEIYVALGNVDQVYWKYRLLGYHYAMMAERRNGVTFAEARAHCQRYGSELASIHNKATFDFVRGEF